MQFHIVIRTGYRSLDEIGAGPSFDETADSFENALAETTKGLVKIECVYRSDTPRPGGRCR
jgi:hypothetical protein